MKRTKRQRRRDAEQARVTAYTTLYSQLMEERGTGEQRPPHDPYDDRVPSGGGFRVFRVAGSASE